VRFESALYDADFVQKGKLDFIWWFVWKFSVLRRFVTSRCDECGKRMWFTSEPCCSDKCYDTWIPF
jgi:uncharacterized OB-fold protein